MATFERVVSRDEFVPPTRREQISALSPPDLRMRSFCDEIYDTTTHKVIVESWDAFFVSKTPPGRTDWLNGPGKEERQETFAEYVARGGGKISDRAHTIGLIGIGELKNIAITYAENSTDQHLLLGDLLQEATHHFFGLPVRWLDRVPLSRLVSRLNSHTNATQLRTPGIHDELTRLSRNSSNKDIFCIMGVTLIDLYPKDEWNFVFGEASPRQRTGVFSFARYTPQFSRGHFRQLQVIFDQIMKMDDASNTGKSTTPPDDEKENQLSFFARFAARMRRTPTQIVIQLSEDDKKQFLRRCFGVLLHELAHIFGLEHCVFFECVMNGSNHLEESDAKPLHLCPVCLKKLHYALRCGLDDLDLVLRYRNLGEFYARIGLVEDGAWYANRADAFEASK